MSAKNTFYITTPIYYVSAKPHLGHLYSTVIADVLARWHSLLGNETFLLTGTDEHGQKIAQAAQKAGMTPKAFVDSFIPAYQDVWKAYEIEYNTFIRTTDPQHIAAVQEWITQLEKKGDIYKALYKGWYCVQDEAFVTEKEYETADENHAPACPSCGRTTVFLSEETYFFKLSAYQGQLLEFYQKNPDFIQPKERAHEVIQFVKSGLKDLSISRTTITWGIPFPNDPKHVVYVWMDALANYITAIGFNQTGKQKEFSHWWPANVHVMGKDIVRFHAVYWPAFLMASDLPLPKHLLVHGWFKVGSQKMSKSLGNVIDPMTLAEQFGVEPVRYYLMRQLAVTHDGELSIEDMQQKIGSDLANDLGNLLNRLVTLAEKNDAMNLDAPKVWNAHALALRDASLDAIREVTEYMQDFSIHMALARVWHFIHQVNSYFHSHEPWKLAKTDADAFKQVISATAHSLRVIAVLLWPVMPTKMQELLTSLGVPFDGSRSLEALGGGTWKEKFVLMKIPLLFERPEMKESEIMQETENKAPANPLITIDDFIKVQLAVGTIEKAELVEKSDKLLKLQVNFGPHGMRQIFSGVRKSISPEDIIGKQATFVLNLQPRKMMGEESQGMMLTAQDESGKLHIVSPGLQVANGTLLK